MCQNLQRVTWRLVFLKPQGCFITKCGGGIRTFLYEVTENENVCTGDDKMQQKKIVCGQNCPTKRHMVVRGKNGKKVVWGITKW